MTSHLRITNNNYQSTTTKKQIKTEGETEGDQASKKRITLAISAALVGNQTDKSE